MMWTVGSAMIQDPGFREMVGPDHFALHSNRSGSYDPTDNRARLRTPFEVNWGKAVRLNHDFLGREALERIAAQPGRRTVTLRWNAEDVIDIHASLLRPGEEFRTMELPTTPSWKDGMLVGVSSRDVYSHFFRECLSMGCVDPELAEPGTELIVKWATSASGSRTPG